MNTLINRKKNGIELNKRVMIHAYKMNGWLYRCWDYPKLLIENKDYCLFDLSNAKVISAEKNTTRSFINYYQGKKIFWVFMKHEWFNFRVIQEQTGYKIYINLASPYLYEECAIKYYDLDLDFKYHSNGSWTEVDLKDLEENAKKYYYHPKLLKIIKHVEKKIWGLIEAGYFNKFISKEFLEYVYTLMDINNKNDK